MNRLDDTERPEVVSTRWIERYEPVELVRKRRAEVLRLDRDCSKAHLSLRAQTKCDFVVLGESRKF